ncbi:MAG: amino acid permease [Vampirovibrio sp.]|nr:amino acid permease [Vampirovibrio sp.]
MTKPPEDTTDQRSTQISEPTGSDISSPSKSSAKTKNQLGTFGGVFTPTILTILGVILFMRSNFVIGEAGIFSAIIILCLAKSITFLTSLSISAIATNMQVRGGGSYFLISRVLGPEFGGAIGMSLFAATALSVPFYIIGFIEALTLTLPQAGPWSLPISLFVAVSIAVVAFIGAQWAIKVQYVIMAILFAAISVFMIGNILNFSPDTFAQNWKAGYTLLDPKNLDGLKYTFWLVFAIYFPAVTGIDAGLNMSGDLKEPTKSLPKGTLLAILSGFLVYVVHILLAGGAYARADLINRPFELLVENAVFGMGFMVVAGVFAATLSSALGSILGAPRVLQALARDPILGILKPFAKGSEQGDEPQRALMFTAVITVIVLCWAYMGAGGDALNAIAAIITMFFLYTYGMINLAAFIEAFGRNPSFRPRFKLFHWVTALLGGLGCVFAAFLINPIAAVIAAVFIFGLISYLTNRQTEASFGDARRGFVYASARTRLLQLAEMEEDAKNWRPTLMVFSGNPNTRESLVSFAVWLSSGRGMVFMADILVGSVTELLTHRDTALKRLKDFCREKNIQAFPMVVVEENIEQGVYTVLQTAGSGLVKPNLAVFGWCDDQCNLQTFLRQLRLARQLDKSIVLVKSEKVPSTARHKTIHLWWRGKDNGNLMMILGHLLKDNWEWSNSRIQVLRAVEESAGVQPARESLQALIDDSRIDAQARVVVSDKPFQETLKQYSWRADCVFLGFGIPEEADGMTWYQGVQDLLEEMPSMILVNSAIEEDILN